MADQACVTFLQWALPRMGMRWKGFRRVRRQVCRRIRARYQQLGLDDHEAYRHHLESVAAEWSQLDALCRVTISRFYRNRRVYDALVALLPALARAAGTRRLRCWSAGCASGEEPYSVVLAADVSGAAIDVVATDADPHMLERARQAVYPAGTLRELDDDTLRRAFTRDGDSYQLAARYRRAVTFLQQDVRQEAPAGSFDLILCRNLAFTYFDGATQRSVAQRFTDHAAPGGLLIVGAHEELPQRDSFEPLPDHPGIYRFSL